MHIAACPDFEAEKDTRESVLAGNFELPIATVSLSKLRANIDWMQQFADNANVKLAPHGKTTMCPSIFDLQLQAGAWAMSLATPAQVAVAVEHGVKRVILANQLVGKGNMTTVSRCLRSAQIYCLVDSVSNVDQLGHFFEKTGQRMSVLIEVGVEGGRTGCRTPDQIEAVVQAVKKWESLSLCGVEVYEGVVHGSSAQRDVVALLDRVVSTTERLTNANAFNSDEILLSGAGSAWYDLVCERFDGLQLPTAVLPVIRPGSYVIHDSGICNTFQNAILQRSVPANTIDGGLENSLEVLAYVQSIPEHGLAILTMGKRDIAFSDGLPSPEWCFSADADGLQAAPDHWEVLELMDQHAFMRIRPNDRLDIGDVVAFSGSHPCLTCDKWRVLHVIDDHHRLIELWPTYF